MPPTLVSMRKNIKDLEYTQPLQRDPRAALPISKLKERGYEKKMTQAARVGKQTGRWLKIEHYRFLKGMIFFLEI